jgi:hypothetical protein
MNLKPLYAKGVHIGSITLLLNAAVQLLELLAADLTLLAILLSSCRTTCLLELNR